MLITEINAKNGYDFFPKSFYLTISANATYKAASIFKFY